jgi:hypothetical protein
MLDLEAVVAPAQERERRVDQRRASAGQIAEVEASTVIFVEEEAGQGLRRPLAPLADVRLGAEGLPRLGHALETTE